METLASFLDAAAHARPQAEVIAYAPQDSVTARMSWSELREQSRIAAKRFVQLGVGKGSRVGFLCSNRTEWLPFAFGAMRIGAVLVPFSTLWKEKEIAYALNHADVQLLVTLSSFRKHDYLERLREVVPELRASWSTPIRSTSAPALRQVFTLGAPSVEHAPPRWEDVSGMIEDSFLDALEARVDPLDTAAIFFTSGTTAQAKAVVHTQAALVASARAIAPRVGIGPEDVWWGHLPLFWSGGFVLGALATIAGGARMMLHEYVDPTTALPLLVREGCTLMAGWHQAGPLLEQPDFAAHKIKLRKGSFHALAERLMGSDHRAVGMYGMSETATVLTSARWDDSAEIRQHTAGAPVEGAQVKIVDPESAVRLGQGETGEIYVKGPSLMEGYYRVPRENVFDAEGFFKTGDRGFLDAEGRLHFLGRLKDVIKTSGVNVAASEVEEALELHPAVKAAHVVGVAHPVRGENVAAFVVVQSGHAADESMLIDFCRQSLASYKLPRHIFFLEESQVPRTASGKVEKVTLRSNAESRLGA